MSSSMCICLNGRLPTNNTLIMCLMISGKKLLRSRQNVARELEAMRAAKQIGSSLEATVDLHTEDADLLDLLKEYEE